MDKLRIAIQRRKWRKKNRALPEVQAKSRAYFKRYFSTENGRARNRSKESRRRQRIAANSFPDAATAYVKIVSKPTVRCFYCGKKMRGRKAHVDHIRPLVHDGPHAAFNLVPACPTCNYKKHDLSANEFIRVGQLILIF